LHEADLRAVLARSVGAGVAIAVDATLVRLVLVPALIVLMGDRAWWAPRRGRSRAAVLSS
jgi:RND superfamily putative drug exporter